MSPVKFCPRCGTQVQQGVIYCMECGLRLSDVGSDKLKIEVPSQGDIKKQAKAEYLCARDFWLKKQLDDAESAYRKAIELDPTLPHPHYDLALLLDARGRPGEEIAEHLEDFLVKVSGQSGLDAQIVNARKRLAEFRAVPQSGSQASLAVPLQVQVVSAPSTPKGSALVGRITPGLKKPKRKPFAITGMFTDKGGQTIPEPAKWEIDLDLNSDGEPRITLYVKPSSNLAEGGERWGGWAKTGHTFYARYVKNMVSGHVGTIIRKYFVQFDAVYTPGATSSMEGDRLYCSQDKANKFVEYWEEVVGEYGRGDSVHP